MSLSDGGQLETHAAINETMKSATQMVITPAKLFGLAIATWSVAIWAGQVYGANESRPRPPAVPQSHSALQVRDGFRIEAVATEPLVMDPISATLDHRGRLWVVEMPDYPLGPSPGDPSRGRIKILRDTDVDGQFDAVTVFADRLRFATGVQPYRDGAFVTLEGAIVWMRDTDADDVADERTVLFTGFAEQNQQLRANHPTLGPDGLIYVAGGLRGGNIQAVGDRYPSRPEPIDLRDRDFYFDPDGESWGAVTGHSQFGLTIDDFGRRFGCSNRNPARMAVIGLDAAERDPLVAPRDAIHDVALAAGDSVVNARGTAWTTSNLHSGQFSAACGVFAPGCLDADGEWLLVCEPTAYVVQRQRLRPDGSVWRARREDGRTEFLSSTNSWFRPVNVSAGPGQSVYVVDMARAVIEHPDFMPTELKSRPDMRDGTGLGRIWKVTPVDDQATPDPLDSNGSALRWLQSKSPWQRQAASEFLLSQTTPPIESLRELLRSSDVSPRGRARSAQLLQRKGHLTGEDLRLLLRGTDPRLRALSVRLSAASDSLLESGPLLEEALRRRADPSPEVVREVAALAGRRAGQPDRRVDALAEIAIATDDPWTIQTIACMHPDLVPQVATQIAVHRSSPPDLLCHLVERIAVESPEDAAAIMIDRLRDELSKEVLAPQHVDLLAAWIAGTKRRGRSAAKTLDTLPSASKISFDTLIAMVATSAIDKSVAPAVRARCLTLSAELENPPQRLRPLLEINEPPQVRVAAIPILLKHDRDWTRSLLATELTGMTGTIRAAAVQACAKRATDTEWLLSQIELGSIPKTVIDPTTSNRLRKHPNQSIRELAQRILKSDPNRLAVLEKYATAAENLGNATAGKKLFREHCSACHQIDGFGTNVGPDISDSRTKTPQALLTSILDPNAAIDSAFIQYNLLTLDGRIIDGLLIDETAESMTLQQKGDQRVTIAKDEIEEIRAPGTSLMPEGFEQTLSVDAMADLISYVKNWRYLNAPIPGNLGIRKSQSDRDSSVR